jgi:hypothetical protein
VVLTPQIAVLTLGTLFLGGATPRVRRICRTHNLSSPDSQSCSKVLSSIYWCVRLKRGVEHGVHMRLNRREAANGLIIGQPHRVFA